MTEIHENQERKEKVILIGVSTREDEDVEASLCELAELADTAGAEVLGQVIQNREAIHPGTYIGKGKIEEVRALAEELGADGVICDDELTPAQLRGLEERLELKVMSGVYAYSVNPELISVLGGKSDTFNMTISQTACGRVGMYDHIRWLLYKIPELSVVKGWTGNEDDGDGDVEFSGVLNPDARDNLSIDTICGTLDSPSPAAKGAYVQASDGMQLRELRRAGVTDRPEQLLIGTLYSQYAERMTTLTGVVRTGHGQPKTFTDAAQEDSVKFIALSERQDCISDSSEVKFCELRPDEYEGKV